MVHFEVGATYGYCVLVLALSWMVNVWQTVQVGQARDKYGVKYPRLYAPEGEKGAMEYNCIQRAHQNFIETWSPVCMLVMVNGLFSPLSSAALGGIWCIGRFLYVYGYSTGGPDGRLWGAIISYLGNLPLLVLTFYNSFKLIFSNA